MRLFNGRNQRCASWHSFALIACLAMGVSLSSTKSVAADCPAEPIRFAAPPWPGITVKTEIMTQILHAIGYETEVLNVGTSLAYQGVASGSADVYTGYWSPNQDAMARKYIEAGEIKILSANIEDAAWGLAVPGYVWEAGVRSVTDLDKYRDRFGGQILGIETGSALNKNIQDAIDQDAAGLGDWNLVASSTPGMLLGVDRAFGNRDWVVWGAWSPHWMMTAFDTKILKNPTDALLANVVTVYTVVPTGYRETNEDAWRFFKQLQISSATQSEWIYRLSREEEPAPEIASEWIQANRDTVSAWLEGVATCAGSPAAEALWAQY